MNRLRILHCWHGRRLMVVLTVSSLDKLFSGCPKQSEREFIRENDFIPVVSSPIPVPCAEYQSVSDVFPGEKWLLYCPSWHQAIHQKLLSHCACRCTTALLPFLKKKNQTLHCWSPDPAAESTLGDGPGTCLTFFGILKPS